MHLHYPKEIKLDNLLDSYSYTHFYCTVVFFFLQVTVKNTSIELRDIITNSTDAIYCIGKTISTYKDFLCFYFVCVFYLFIFLKYLPIYFNCLFLKNMLTSNKIILKYNGFCLAYLYLIFFFLTYSLYNFSEKQKFYLTIIHFFCSEIT